MVAYANGVFFISEAYPWEAIVAMASQNNKKAMELLKKPFMVLNSRKVEAAYVSKSTWTIKIDNSLQYDLGCQHENS